MDGVKGDYGCAVVLQTAVSIETEGVKRLYKEWRALNYEDDDQTYYETGFMRKGVKHRVILAQQEVMGMPAAVSLSHKLIERFRPRYLIMPGIAAGIGAEQIFGDVIVADTVWNYSYGKFVSAGEAGIKFGNVGFLPRPTRLFLSEDVAGHIREAVRSPENEFHIHIGPMACGSAVVSNSEVVEKQVRVQFPQTAGLDMESYGVFYAARHAAGLKPEPIVLKSVCDFADEGKNYIYQKFAAFTSSEFARLLYENYLPLE